MPFSGIIGHAAAKTVLEKAAESPRPGYLITGPSGIGSHAIAEAFVRMLANHPAPQPLSGHPDIAVLARGWNEAGTALRKEIAVRDVRDLRARVSERPVIAPRVTAYLPDADFLNEEGVNALLKSTEEPPAGAVFVLVSRQPGKLPATLQSRLQRLTLRRVDSSEIDAWLAAQGFGAAERETAIAIADGRPGIALRFVTDELFRERVIGADRIIEGLLNAERAGDAFAAIAGEASRCDASDDAVTEWRDALQLWGAALRRRIGTSPSSRAYGIGHAFITAERHLGGPISPRIILELGLNRIVSGAPAPFPEWTGNRYPFPL